MSTIIEELNAYGLSHFKGEPVGFPDRNGKKSSAPGPSKDLHFFMSCDSRYVRVRSSAFC